MRTHLLCTIFRHKNIFLSKVRFSSSYSDLLEQTISKSYNSAVVEEGVRERWKKENIPRKKLLDDDNQVFRMVLPPPNVTGKLHLGHALTVAIEDTIIRWKMMTGSSVHWIPGFDHAGIATQSVVLRKLQKVQSLGDPKKSIDVLSTIEPGVLQDYINDFSKTSQKNISSQLEKLGTTLDWDSLYYTKNKVHTSIVEEAFISLFESGLIRRGDGMVNWSCALRSGISDIECVSADFTGKITLRVPGHKQLVEFGCLYFINYKLENSNDTITVATSRPETIFGDVAIAVNPEDSRFTKHIGSRVVNPLNGRLLPIIGDSRVKVDFGSGALKVTPAHDKVDFKIGTDHNLEMLNILTEDGHLNENCCTFAGLGRFAARKAVIKKLTEAGALVDTKDYTGSVNLCSRTGDVIEQRILPHWFLQTQWLTERIVECLNNNELSIQPESQKTILLQQLSRSIDWCLSRQIQWGHQIPAYYHSEHPDVWVAAFNKESAKKKLEQKLSIVIDDIHKVHQDSDVLDTWFSSGLIPLAISGWPEINAKDFKTISLMETGHDILLFWVYRMVLLNLALIDRLPFRHVVLHSIITDPYGRKMSKSRGNVVDPLHIIDGQTFPEMLKDAENAFQNGELDQNEYKLRLTGLKKDYPKGFPTCGADALRLAILSQDIFKQDIRLDMAHLENCKHFMNKMWQAMRFYFLHADKGVNHPTEISKPDVSLTNSLADSWILACLHRFNLTMEQSIPDCQFHVCADAIRQFFYRELCDVYIELVKSDLQNNVNAENHILTMRYLLGTALKLMHPFVPFISEEMWYHITQDKNGLLVDSRYPHSNETLEFKNDQLISDMSKGLKIASEIRSLRTKMKIDKKATPVIYAECNPKDMGIPQVLAVIDTLSNCKVSLESPLRSDRPHLVTHAIDLEKGKTCKISMVMQSSSTDDSFLSLPTIDPVKVLRLQQKLAKLTEKLNNPAFLKFADNESKDELKKKMQMIKTKIAEIGENNSSKKER